VHVSNYSGEDRRKRDRSPTEQLAQLELHGSDQRLLGLVKDVSVSGLCVETISPPTLGERVTIRAILSEHEHGVQGEVVRVQMVDVGHYVVGVVYDPLALEEDPFLEAVLHKSLPVT
jgi:PilZ domain